ncbi:hypothetical protein AVEN_150042-1 [Araneus ventricosus]|uniref:Uncharacterized protein n=1 Tax=Araneus ventricosus TaxID=182803 RepID=A0A4Y2AIR9_ARAVE|nr:hypothetical protein AVEN_150042-1 [Araneus ventricosus]
METTVTRFLFGRSIQIAEFSMVVASKLTSLECDTLFDENCSESPSEGGSIIPINSEVGNFDFVGRIKMGFLYADNMRVLICPFAFQPMHLRNE